MRGMQLRGRCAVNRSVYKEDDGSQVAYEIDRGELRGHVRFRLYDVCGDDALVFLTPKQTHQLILDLGSAIAGRGCTVVIKKRAKSRKR